MADLDIIHRRSFAWLWWVVGILLLGALVWYASTTLEGEPADLRDNPEAPPPSQQMPPAG